MSVTVRIPTQLRPLTGGAGESPSRGPPSREVVRRSRLRPPGFADRLFDDNGNLRRFVNIFVADEDVRFLQGLDTPSPRPDALDRPGGRRRLPAHRRRLAVSTRARSVLLLALDW